jgi:hypothetical protein
MPVAAVVVPGASVPSAADTQDALARQSPVERDNFPRNELVFSRDRHALRVSLIVAPK